MKSSSVINSIIIAATFIFLAKTIYSEDIAEKSKRIHQESFVIDTHIDTLIRILDGNYDLMENDPEGHISLPYLKEGGYDAVIFSLWVEPSLFPNRAKRLLDLYDALQQQLQKHSKDIELALTPEDIIRINKKGKVAALMGIEGGHGIEGDIRILRVMHQLGVRYLTITWSVNNEFADSSSENEKWGGLSPLGKELIKEMNKLGMIIDVSHVSDKTFFDILKITNKPIIASHSSVRAICSHHRNLTDDQLKALAKNGGVVFINFYPAFLDEEYRKAIKKAYDELNPQLEEIKKKYKDDFSKVWVYSNKLIKDRMASEKQVPLDKIVEHIDYVVKLIGDDYVGIGSDFDGMPTTPVGMENASKLPQLTLKLLQKGYSEESIKKILGGNFIRVFKEVSRK